MQEFPKWMYHRTEAARIVDDPAEQDALGPDWAEHPAAFDVPVTVIDLDGLEVEEEAPAVEAASEADAVTGEGVGGEEVAPAAAAADAPKPKRGK